MSLSQLLKVNTSFLLTISTSINTSMVCLLLILQLAIWYPTLSEEQSHLENQIKRRDRALTAWQKIKKQSNVIENNHFLQTSWTKQKIGMKEKGVVTQWQVEGQSSITEWQTLLEYIQERLSLGLVSVHWKRESSGDWYGRLSFDIQSPKANREYDNWLPTMLHIERIVEKDWRLLSTMREGDNVSALLEHKNNRYWVHQGSWLPVAGLTVDAVSFDRVALMTKGGQQIELTVSALTISALSVGDVGEEHD